MRLYRHLQRPDCRLTLVSPDIFYIKKQNMRAKFRCACGWEGFKFVKDVLHDEQIECRTCSAKRRALNPTVKQMRHQRRFAVMQTTSTAHVYDILNCGPRNRFVANGKLVHNSGGDKINPQNLPRGGVLREAIQAPEGYRLVACDSSNIEARVLAWFAGQADLVQEFRDGADVYSSFASKIYGRPINKHDDPNERHVGKTCLAAGTEVLTNHGWKAIEAITQEDLLWDGVEWVSHDGVAEIGKKPTLTMYGVRATPDHACMTGRTFAPWQTLAQDGTLFQRALSSASLPSSDTPTSYPKVGALMGGTRSADAHVDGKGAS